MAKAINVELLFLSFSVVHIMIPAFCFLLLRLLSMEDVRFLLGLGSNA
jgi:hypothetical protein